MTFDEAETIRKMIDGHWNLRMTDETADLWLTALLPKDAELATKTVSRLADTMHMPPKIVDLEEVYVMLMPKAEVPPAGSGCPTCHGDRFVLVQRVAPLRSRWLQERGAREPDEPYVEQMAPCPDCNKEADTSFRRADGTMVETIDPMRVREMMRR